MICVFLKLLVLCVFLKSILKCHSEAVGFIITLVSVLKSVDKVFLKRFLKIVLCKCINLFFEQASRNYLLYSKGSFFCSFPLDNAILLLVSR